MLMMSRLRNNLRMLIILKKPNHCYPQLIRTLYTNFGMHRTISLPSSSSSWIACKHRSVDYMKHSVARKNLSTTSCCYDTTAAVNIEGSLFKRLLKSMGIGKFKYNKSRLKVNGYKMCVAIDEKVDFTHFMKELQLPDTFYSYYLVCELHVWMLMCRLSQEGEDGKLVKQFMCQALWENIDTKSKKIGNAGTSSARKGHIAEMGGHFNAAMFAYDEAILCDDKTLAGALWRTVYHMQYVDPGVLEQLVAYVRKQVAYLDEQDSFQVVNNANVDFLSFHGDKKVDNKR